MKRLALFLAVLAIVGIAAGAQAQVAVSVRLGPPARYVVPVRPVVYPVAPVVYRPVYAAPVVYRPYYPVRPVVVARPYCGPVCRANIREERREFRAERRFARHEAWERHERWEHRHGRW